MSPQPSRESKTTRDSAIRQQPLFWNAHEFDEVDQLLDVGGGTGQAASLLKECHPRIKITVFDLPDVCNRALDFFRAIDQGRDLGVHPGNFFVDPFPSGFRFLQFRCVLELFAPHRIIELLEKAYESLPRSGIIFIYGAALPDSIDAEFSSRTSHFFSIYETRPFIYAAADYMFWLQAIGFVRINCRQDSAGNMFLNATK